MTNFHIPEKEKCPQNGYYVQYSKDLIDELCKKPKDFNSNLYKGAINNAITIYKYSDYISRDWIENVIDTLSPYVN